MPLDVQATAFQWQVWQALGAIPYGETRTYGEIARIIGKPGAVRAVARACASNPVALAIPCHRVVPAAGGAGGYRWGATRKSATAEDGGRGRPIVSAALESIDWAGVEQSLEAEGFARLPVLLTAEECGRARHDVRRGRPFP